MQQTELARLAQNFHCTIAALDRNYIFAKFHMFLAWKLQQVVEGKIKRVCISVPPRHGKSRQISEMLPPYALGRNPDEHIMAISYGASLAAGFGLEARRLMGSDAYKSAFPGAVISGRGNNASDWSLEGKRQSYFACGVGGGITGRPCTLGLIDDAIKNRAQANSATYQRGLKAFFGADFFSRLEPDARVIVVNTRWSKQDLIGYILENLDGWEYIRIPAICDSPQDPLHRQIGEPLFPEKYDRKALKEIRATVGEQEWASLYQQDPIAGAGSLWKPIFARYITEKPFGFIRIIASWDCASELHELADYTVCTIWGELPNGKVVNLNTIRERLGFTSLVAKIVEVQARYKPDEQLVEKASNGVALLQYLEADPETYGHINAISISAHTNKQLVYSTVTPMFEAGDVLFWAGADNCEQLVTELSEYPSCSYDDCTISTIQALSWIMQNPAKNIIAIPSIVVDKASRSSPLISVHNTKIYGGGYGIV